jgi:hypothetical protein
LPTNIRLGWKGLSGRNALAYRKKVVDYDRKKFYNIGPSIDPERGFAKHFQQINADLETLVVESIYFSAFQQKIEICVINLIEFSSPTNI